MSTEVVQRAQSVPGDVLGSPSLEVLGVSLDVVQDNPTRGPFSMEGWTWLQLERSGVRPGCAAGAVTDAVPPGDFQVPPPGVFVPV